MSLGKGHGKAEVQQEKMMPTGRAVLDVGKVLVQAQASPFQDIHNGTGEEEEAFRHL